MSTKISYWKAGGIAWIKKGMELYGWCIMTSHVHMINGTHGEAMENIMRDMKRHTSETLKNAIKSHPAESRRDWLIWMMERAGKKNCNNIEFQLWQQDNHPIILNTARLHTRTWIISTTIRLKPGL